MGCRRVTHPFRAKGAHGYRISEIVISDIGTEIRNQLVAPLLDGAPGLEPERSEFNWTSPEKEIEAKFTNRKLCQFVMS